MKLNQKTSLALAVCAFIGLHGTAHAQSNSDLLKELQSIKDRMMQLEKQLPSQKPAAIDPDEFNRIRAKVEAAEDNTESLGFKGLRISGMIDPTYVYNKRQDTSGFVFLGNLESENTRPTENSPASSSYSYDNSYFGVAVLDLQKETDAGQKWRLTLAPHKSASSGYNTGTIVHEASVSLPIDGPSTRVFAGQLPDWTGYEYYWSNLQPLISHNLLFDFTIPSYYSGAGMEFTRDKWVSKFLIGNINATRQAPSSKPGLTYRADYAKGEYSGFGLAGTHTFDNGTKVNLFEMDGYFIRGDWTMQGQIGVGTAEGLASNLDDAGNAMKASWTGVSGLLGYKITPRLQLTGRADYIRNHKNGGGVFGSVGSRNNDIYTPDQRNGFGLPMLADGSGTDGQSGVNRYALSIGTSYLISANHTPGSGLWTTGTWFKTELRYDGASGRVFYDARDASYKKNNLMFSSSLVFAF
ncbi:DUF3138 family protein [Limnohabitans sp.]|uniref:DUF3138 family protein n=1 Tax=Limnohabitans sp. TaxID=1907725 RepID=UPI00286F597E|nr:DUF3138 family protein [Limnohabitans sp.]